MKIQRALEIVQAKDRPIPYVPPGPPETATLWNLERGTIIPNAVYFAYSGGLVKIGYSGLPRDRLAALVAGASLPVTMVLLVPGNEAVEHQFHARFADDRAHHEWFRLSKRMRDFFRARLCPVGRGSLKKAEEDFKTYCREQLA